MTALTDLLDELVPVDGRHVADVGCGDGWLARRLAARGGAVVGGDPSLAALAAARAAPAVSGERYLQGGAESLPMPDGSCDVVILFNSLHHVPAREMPAALSEAVRVARDDGFVFVQEPLAEGPFFELMRPVSDETAVRAAALEALGRASTELDVTVSHRTFTPSVGVASFEAWREHQLLVDAGRAPVLRAREAELRERFERLGHTDGSPPDMVCSFAAPARVTLLRRRAA